MFDHFLSISKNLFCLRRDLFFFFHFNIRLHQFSSPPSSSNIIITSARKTVISTGCVPFRFVCSTRTIYKTKATNHRRMDGPALPVKAQMNFAGNSSRTEGHFVAFSMPTFTRLLSCFVSRQIKLCCRCTEKIPTSM